MAEDPKIVNSPPPVEPHDVKVVPSPPPAEPFDVPTYPSPPPAEPFDVKVYPDPPPGGTFDVPTSPDPAPKEPFDVPTLPDSPPAAPFDVPTSPDGPPAEPFDVPTIIDGPPAEPFDVITAPDGPPADPFDVAVTPDPPPAGPVDPSAFPFDPGVTPLPDPQVFEPSIEQSQQILPDGLWIGPTPAIGDADNVQIDKLLFDPATVESNQNPGKPPLPDPIVPSSNPGRTPTMFEIINAVKGLDATVGNFLSDLVDASPINISTAGGGALDPITLAMWFRDYLNTVGPGGVAKFAAQQAILYAMNPVVAKVFDPLYFVKMMIPGSMGNFHTTIDTQAGLTMENIVKAQDALLPARIAVEGVRGADDNTFNPRSTFNEGQPSSVDEMIDAAIGENGKPYPHPFTSPVRHQNGLTPVQKFDALKYFDSRDSFGRSPVSLAAKSRVALSNVQSDYAKLAASNFIEGVVRVPIGAHEDADGAVYSPTQNPTGLVDDDDTRVPLCFTDLRKVIARNAFRSVYFRPLNLSFSKSITPEWSEGSAFGRVDPIVAYQKTTRTYAVNFEVHAFAPEDLEVMYNKMTWLDSMCYPSYGSDSLIRSGPVVRMRIGDAVSTESGGLTGIIKSLSFDFAEALWELKRGFKVPRSYKVTVEFLALHEGPVGILNGEFGVFKLPTGAPNGETDTTNPGGPTQSQEGQTRVATIQPGKFAKFGEPRK